MKADEAYAGDFMPLISGGGSFAGLFGLFEFIVAEERRWEGLSGRCHILFVMSLNSARSGAGVAGQCRRRGPI